jgi:hypothetical protein
MTSKTDNDFLLLIDMAIERAGSIMDLDDLEYDETSEKSMLEYESEWENRFHCGKCVVRTVMEEIYPAIDEYILFLKEQAKS